MASLPVLDELPETYAVERAPHAFAAVLAEAAADLAAAGWSAEGDPATQPSTLAGRRPLFELETPGEAYLVRRFSHGGLLRWATGERFFDPERPFREIVLSEHLRTHGIATPRVIAARARVAPGGVGWILEVVTRRVPRTADLGMMLVRSQRGELDPGELRPLLVALGRLVARLHGSDFLHADLNPANVLVELESLAAREPRLWVLDLDRSRVGPLPPPERWRNLGRLFRHVDRREAERGRSLSRTDYRRFLLGYDPEGSCWKDAWRAIDAARGRQGWHRLGWMLERRLGSQDPRTR